MMDGSLAALITGGFAVLMFHLTNRRLKRVNAHVEETKDQVKNSHQTNLRDDLDLMHADVRILLLGQEETKKLVDELRKEVQHERDERLAVGDRLDTHLAAHVKEGS